MSLLDVIPGYREAIEREAEIRENGFVLPYHSLCGFKVEPITLRHLIVLFSIKSPFLCGGAVTPEQVAMFLWVMSTEFSFKPDVGLAEKITAWRKERFFRKCSLLKYTDTVNQIDEFIASSLQDSLPSKGEFNKAPAACFAADICHIFAKKYGWTDEYTMRLPVVRLYQYLKLMRIDADPKAPYFNRSDTLKSQYLHRLNNG